MLAAAEDAVPNAVEDESVGLVEVVPLEVVVDGAVEVAVAGEAVVVAEVAAVVPAALPVLPLDLCLELGEFVMAAKPLPPPPKSWTN